MVEPSIVEPPVVPPLRLGKLSALNNKSSAVAAKSTTKPPALAAASTEVSTPRHFLSQQQAPTPETQELFSAAEAGAATRVIELLRGGSASPLWYNSKAEGNTGLHAASAGGHLQVVDAIFDLYCHGDEGLVKEALTCRSTAHQETPLHAACSGGCVDVVKRLLSRGADPNVTNSFGTFPLHQAAQAKDHSAATVRLLLDAGASPAATNRRQSSALHFAIYGNGPEVIPPRLPTLRSLPSGLLFRSWVVWNVYSSLSCRPRW